MSITKKLKVLNGVTCLLLAGPVLSGCDPSVTLPGDSEATEAPIPVSGSALHFFSTALIHSQEPTERGMIQRSTDIVQLSGDLNGYLVYHVTSTFDFGAGSLVNTGIQFFSGTITGSDPVVLRDDRFHFVVDLSTGETLGKIYLRRSDDATDGSSWFGCDLVVVGTGTTTPEGDGRVDYSGECTPRR